MTAPCPICPHACAPAEGKFGVCGARKAQNGVVVDENYGKVTALALDPIEKKPLYRFMPGAYILSAGSYGCNLRCPFCQNADISLAPDRALHTKYFSPEQIVQLAEAKKPDGNVGVAYTYNEPLVGYEFVLDCAKLVKSAGMANVVVTNGYINKEPLLALLPYIDAMNIDLKAFTQAFYQRAGGSLETVKRSIALAAAQCHVEVTTLIIPGENDSPEEMDELAAWLASVNRKIPLHVTRFFPRHKMKDRPPTDVATVKSLAQIARNHLKFVYEGNC